MIELDDRFWSKTKRDGDCLLWTGACARKGSAHAVPAFSYAGITVSARKLALAAKLNVDYDVVSDRYEMTCGNGLCVNPDHCRFRPVKLPSLVNRSKGSASPIAKLTEEQVSEMRERFRKGEGTPNLALAYGVSQMTAYNAVHGVTWKHVPNPAPKGGHSKHKLSDDQVRQIRQSLHEGVRVAQLATWYGVSPSLIYGIKRGHTRRNA